MPTPFTRSVEMLTEQQTARLLGRQETEVRMLASSGQLRCFWLGRSGEDFRFLRCDVEKFRTTNFDKDRRDAHC